MPETFNVGDRIIMNDAATYAYSAPGAEGVIVAIHGSLIGADFDQATLSDAYKLHKDYAPGKTEMCTVDTKYCTKIAYTTSLTEDPLAGRINSLEALEAVLELLRAHDRHNGAILRIHNVYEHPTRENYPVWRDKLRVFVGYYTVLDMDAIGCGTHRASQDGFLHISKQEGDLSVAFYADDEKHARDICTRMKMGKYLTKYHPELSNEQVKKFVAKFEYLHGPAPTVHYGVSQEAFIKAIGSGPSESCMATLTVRGHIHPAAVYASGDMTVAWLTDGSRITARTIINNATKHYSRCYGDHAKLMPLLNDAGYEQSNGALVGCRLLRMDNEDGGGYIMPYVDAGIGSGGGYLYYMNIDAEHWELTSDNDYKPTYCGYEFGGVTQRQECDDEDDDYGSCDRCGDAFEDEDDRIYSEYNDETVCEHCADLHYVHARDSACGPHSTAFARSSDCTWVECMGEHVFDTILGDLDIVIDAWTDEYIFLADARECVLSGSQFYCDDCTECGTDSDGNSLYVHDHALYSTDNGFYRDADNRVFFVGSAQVQYWLTADKDENWDPNEFKQQGVAEVAPVAKVEALNEQWGLAA